MASLPSAHVAIRLALTGIWLGALALIGVFTLLLVGGRVGEGRSSSYGQAWQEFTASWGGEIAVQPPSFALEWQAVEVRTDEVLKERVEVMVGRSAPLPITDMDLDVTLDHSTQSFGSLAFNAFRSKNMDRFEVTNDAGNAGRLMVTVPWPAGASLLNDYTVRSGDQLVTNPALGRPFPLVELADGEVATVEMTWSTKGADEYTWRLSALKDRVLPHAHARLRVDTDQFALVRFGLDHTRRDEGGTSIVEFDLRNFSTSQDLGVRFASQRKDLIYVQQVLEAAPLALLTFLAALFVGSQVRGARVAAFHHLPMMVAFLSFYALLGYLVRWLPASGALAVATGVSLLLTAILAPPAFGVRGTLLGVVPWQIAFTIVYAAFFQLPSLKGLAVLALLLLSLTLLLARAVRSEPGKWPIFLD